jgi:photosystem II stability/assembly factor-like uncharacterized protein
VEAKLKQINVMSQMINRGNELIRIDPKNSTKLEYSTDGGRYWQNRCSGNGNVGNFQDLTENGKEILATTSNGLFYTTDEGRYWQKR